MMPFTPPLPLLREIPSHANCAVAKGALSEFHEIRHRHHRGFALVVTLSLMILLTIVTVGLLSLASVTLRSSSLLEATSTARANARLSLMLALGELQNYAGPDQRITATASILDSNPETEALEQVGEASITGVWDSWSHDPLQSATAPDYNKSSRFRRWLVSGLTEAQAGSSLTLTNSPFRQSKDGVCLVGKNTTLDPASASAAHVWAGRVALATLGNKNGGHYAYAVMDEGGKARIDLAPSAAMSSDELARAASGAPHRNAFSLLEKPSLTQGTPLASYHAVRDKAASAITLSTAPLLGGASSALAPLGPYFNDLTTDSMGVLADVARGGLRRDLSLFGELPTIPADFKDRRLYTDSDTPMATDSASTDYGFGSSDPYWSLIYDHLNIGKRLGPATGNTLPTLAIHSLPVGFTPGSGSADTFKISRGAQRKHPLAPVILRAELMFSFFVKETHSVWVKDLPAAFGGGAEGAKWNHMLHLIYTPMITLWNPYNVPITLSQPVIEIANPPVALRFIREKSPVATAVGEITNRLVPLDEMYSNSWEKFDKKFVMQLYGELSPAGVASGDVKLLPGEVKLFSPAIPPGWNFSKLFDYQNQLTDRANAGAQIKAAPGWRGPQYGFNIDWLAGSESYVNPPRNGSVKSLGIIGSRLEDRWDVECGLALPRKKDGSAIRRYSVSLLTSAGASSGVTSGTLLSRLEFDYGADPGVLAKALTAPGAQGTGFPFRMSQYLPPANASSIRVGAYTPVKEWIVQPFMVMSAQAKTSSDATFPSRSWIHNAATRPLSYQLLKSDPQAGNSHELALLKYENGMATDAKIDAANRSYGFGGATALLGSQFCIHRELALSPVQSVAQLSHFDLAASGYPGAVDHPVGNSFAHPMVKPESVSTTVAGQKAIAIDHTWLSNSRLWDSWYASTFNNLKPPYWPRQAALREIIEDFTSGIRPLPNSRLIPWSGGRTKQGITELLSQSASSPKDDAYQKAAAVQMLKGAFNVNSTSKAAWKAILGGLDRETLAMLSFNGTDAFSLSPSGLTTAGPYLSRQRLPGAPPADAPGNESARAAFWRGGCQLTPAELDALAAGIVREVKRRGPFLSLAEFVNRRLGPSSELTQKGAVQAAVDDAPGIGDLNSASQGARKDLCQQLSRTLTAAEISASGYPNPEAAQGHTVSGASGALDQLAVLNSIGAVISARSDTFKIRCYGDATDASGKISARAYIEAVVQRVPDYLVPTGTGGNQSWDSPSALNTTNQKFGRRFNLVSFRWLSPAEI